MNLRRPVRISVIPVLLGFFFACQNLSAGTIRLRNETIDTTPVPRRAAVAPPATDPVSGLYLIQFTVIPDEAARQDLANHHVTLLEPVPEKAFVARLQAASIQQLRSTPGVEWVGPYRPEHKLHSSLSKRLAAVADSAPLDVSILLATGVTQLETLAVRGLLEKVTQESNTRAGGVLRGRIDRANLVAAARSEAVLWIEPQPKMKLNDEVSSKLVAGDGGPGELLTQVLGYDGKGVRVAVADSGLDTGEPDLMHPDLRGRTPAFFAYGGLPDAADEHSHGTHVAGIIAGNATVGEKDENGALYGLGVAPGAEIIGQRIFDGAGGYYPPPSYEKLTRDALSAGAVIGSNSWGDDTQGRYDISAREFDALVRDADALKLGDQPYILEFSAGNAGPGAQTVGSPAVAKNVIATGASQNDRLDFIIYGDGIDAMADFSSRGPCEDGRIKPDVVAPGTWIASLQSSMAPDIYAWTPISQYYQYQGGTSQAGPHASGAAAVFVQYYRRTHGGATPSPALVKAALINSALDLPDQGGTGPTPNNDEGWGAIDLTYLLDPSIDFFYLDQSVLLTNSQTYEKRFLVADREVPLKITLTYTDVPGFPATIPSLVNDLDLELVGPDGTVYRGNQFSEGISIPNPAVADAINNVEGIHLPQPVPGEYLLRVRAHSIVQDARADTPQIDQDFALVISSVPPKPGVGSVILDRNRYTAPAQVKVTVIDTDLAAQSSLSVTVRSTTEPAGETIQLNRTSLLGVFAGTISTSSSSATADGKLQVKDGDSIEAIYRDQSAGADRLASAVADLVAPQISNVVAQPDFGRAVITWATSEAASSLVVYGTNQALGSLNLSRASTRLVTDHELILENLVSGKTYYYYVVAVDEAGNLATNSNNGSLFSLLIPATAPVLLVDEYQDELFGAPPIDGYTEALNQLGVSYDTWDVGSKGEPALSVLSRYQALVWRVPELTGAWSTTERSSISNYLAGGGALFVASMEMLTRLDQSGGAAFIKDVLHVQSYVIDPDSTGAAFVTGVPGDPVGNGIDVTMDYSPYELLWGGFLGPDLSDTMMPGPGATAALHNDNSDTVGIRWPAKPIEGSGRLVLLSFPLDAVPMGSGANDRVALLRNALTFLAPGVAGLEALRLDAPAYTLPARALVELGDASLAGQKTITVQAKTDSSPSPIPVVLHEVFNKPGLFSGAFELLAATNTAGPGELLAKAGDTVTLSFSDPAGRTFTATAVIDLVPPTISNVEAEPSYEEATVYWQTSEPSDALVQFGESILLGRTAFEPALSTYHGLTLKGLTPNKTYYYQVVSRDSAGNAATDNNKGKFYTFTTLQPLAAPWSDDVGNDAATNWSVFSAEGSQAEWTLGVPNNGDVTGPHSPPVCWGTRLDGSAIDFTETFLVSPAVFLGNGNKATLTFWHSYDFTEKTGFEIEYGELSILTNYSALPITLAQFSDASGGWTKDQVDLTPYMGRVVSIAWHYVLFSLDSAPRPGWVVDDVSITVSNVQSGTIEITNNLSQASFVLSGPTFLRSQGLSYTITNAPPGDYVMEYAEIPYYIAPPARTNTLAPGGKVRFDGQYTFTDSNHNGIPDAWETAMLGSVAPSPDPGSDSDKDGMTDYAEFVAGTNPTNAASTLTVSASLTPQATGLLTRWDGHAGRSYALESSTNGVNWSLSTSWVRATADGPLQFSIPVDGVAPSRMYRLIVRP